ncbi:polyprenol monophosphomannose synthase [Apibacter adventoris]|uniref:Dolichyl-phosphate beta-D-mannosyltransferase n=1 Tax=Apibacter adventoris TaxID=1679466 RepID=A0A2S8ACE5_9FLAO|nr:polyprenol monophosphomannose synthase [Apibacter adventoris]PQL92626.1 dolichyl-phosphate beta-D-mannosyltransferase [Apibacter adventoris]
MPDKKLVIIPTYNEKENIKDIIYAVLNLNEGFNILVVDDSSPDDTGKIVKDMKVQYPEQIFLEERTNKEGLGRAYIHGFTWAINHKYDYIFEMDADFSHNPNDLIRLYEACKNGADMAIGSRYSQGVNVVNWPMNRVLLSFFASKYVQFITGLPIHDSTAGFVCFTRKVLENIPLNQVKLVGYGFQIEMKFRAFCKKFKIVEIPIIFTDRTKGHSKMNGAIISEAVFGVIKMKIMSLIGKL